MLRDAKFVRTLVLTLGSVLLFSSVYAAEPYDKRLEFIESTGTQWIDTGLKLHYRNSKAQVNFRVVEVPAATVSICGVTAQKDVPTGYTSGANPRASFVIRLNRVNATTYRLYPSFTGGEDGGYRWPDGGTTDLKRVWTVENSWELNTSASYYGTNMSARINGNRGGGYYRNYKNEVSAYNYYIGVANNAGEGLFDAEGSMAKVQWYGAKFWTDGVLVGNFIPVMKNGVAGFYDTVTAQFFASQGADAWVAPVEREWTGLGAANDLYDTANWKDATKPTTVHEVAVIPDDTSIVTNIPDGCAFFSDVGAIRLNGEDTLLHFDGQGSAGKSFYPAVGGVGRFRLTGQTSNTKSVYLFSSLQNFRGITEISNVSADVCNVYCLGDGDQAEAYVYMAGSEQRFSWGASQYCSDFRSNVHFRRKGQFLFFSGSARVFGDTIFDHQNIDFHGNGNQSGEFFGKMTGNAVGANTINPYSAANFTLSEQEKDLKYSMLYLQADKNIIACRVKTLPRKHNGLYWDGVTKISGADGCGQNMANIRMASGRPLTFKYENALDENVFVQVGYPNKVSTLKSNTIDLNGYNQRFGTLSVWSGAGDSTEVCNTNLWLTSASPATLTIYGYIRNDQAMYVYPGQVRGAASVTLDSKDEVMADAYSWTAGKAGVVKFNCPGSDTTGSLAVNRGTMVVMETATFSNLASVVVSGSGVMKLNSSEVGNANPEFKVEIKDSTATLELAEGVSNVCYTCEVPNGAFLAPGVYSGTAQEGTIQTDYLSGAGKLEVKVNGAPWTGWPEAGTTNAVYIIRNTAVTIEDSDIPKVQALETVECGTGVTIDCLLSEGQINLLPKFIGDVKIRYWGKGPDDVVTISGDNSGLVAPGGWFLSNCTAKVMHRYGLGTAETAPAEIYSIMDSSYSVLEFNGASVTQNDVVLKFVNAAKLYHADPAMEFVQNADINASGLDTNGSRRFILRHRMTIAAGHAANLYTITMSSSQNEPCVFTVAEGATLNCIGNFGTGTYVINGSYLGEMRIEQCMTKIILGRDDAIVSGYTMMYDGSEASFRFDLNGHDLHLRDICGNQYPLSTWAFQQVIPIVSDTAATFSITGDVSTAASTRCAISFTGAASCRIASGASQDNIFGKGVSRTTGSLIMDSGKLKLEREFKWLGGPVQLNGGELTVDATTAPNVFGNASGIGRSRVVLVPGAGTLKLSSANSTDETAVYCVQTGDDTFLEPGAYVAGASGSPAWLTGTGTLRVLQDKLPPPGVIFIIR